MKKTLMILCTLFAVVGLVAVAAAQEGAAPAAPAACPATAAVETGDGDLRWLLQPELGQLTLVCGSCSEHECRGQVSGSVCGWGPLGLRYCRTPDFSFCSGTTQLNCECDYLQPY